MPRKRAKKRQPAQAPPFGPAPQGASDQTIMPGGGASMLASSGVGSSQVSIPGMSTHEVLYTYEGQADEVYAPEGDMVLPFASRTHGGDLGKKNEVYDEDGSAKLSTAIKDRDTSKNERN